MKDARDTKHRVAGAIQWQDGLILAVLAGIVLILVGTLGWESARPAPLTPHPNLLAVSHWFDPVFFQYNLVLLAASVLVIPFVTFSYVHTMMGRKERRLQRELPESRRGEIQERLRSRVAFSAYLGSVSLNMLIVLLGTSIILLFKPVPSSEFDGVDFSRGANVLMMGPFIELFHSHPHEYYLHLMRSLCAFQFGFLGAYIYFIGMLARAYFTLDLTPQTFMDGTLRMICASALALVISFHPGIHGTIVPPSPSSPDAPVPSAHPTEPQASAPGEPAASATSPNGNSGNTSSSSPESSEDGVHPASQVTWSLSLLPILSFVFGFFPKWALLGLRHLTLKLLQSFGPERASIGQYRALPLSALAGMSHMHEARLEREGFDNIENFSTADPVSLAVSTGFRYPQLVEWISAAWLATHLREDYPEFVRRTGITTRDELVLFLTRWNGSLSNAVDLLAQDPSSSPTIKVKLTVLSTLLCPEKK